jgi:DNA-binding transcriptional ArsR family regulator
MSKRTASFPKFEFPPQPAIEGRSLINARQAAALMRLFKVFANDTRLRLLHALVREGELCVTELAEAVELKPQAVSNQLQRLVDRSILGTRRDGSNIYYRVIDPCVSVLLERGLCLIECCPEKKGHLP